MRLSGLACALLVLGASVPALGQVPVATAPAQEPTPPPPPPPPEPLPLPPPPPPAPPEPAEATPPDDAPVAPAESSSTPPATSPAPSAPPEEITKPPEATLPKTDAPRPFNRARSPITLDGRIGFSWRPEGDSGFDDEDTLGSELGASLYFELKPEIAAGVEVERTTLGRGTAITGLDSVSADYTVTSALLGFRAYPLRRELLDVFVGFQVGVGVQGVSASGTQNNGGVQPASVYTCSGTEQPAFQIGGGIGARFMISERWGVTARVNGTGRRLSGELVDDCAKGVGTVTSVSGSLSVGYDFDMD